MLAMRSSESSLPSLPGFFSLDGLLERAEGWPNELLAFAADPDYDAPADADTDNVYVVTVLVDDGTDDDTNGATTLTITVTDVNDVTPVYQAADADDAISVAENFGTGTIVASTICPPIAR